MSRMYYFTNALSTHGYKKCGGTVGSEYFYKKFENETIGIIVCEYNMARIKGDADVERVRGCYQNVMHGIGSNNILVVVFGCKNEMSFETDNVIVVEEMCDKISEIQIDKRFSDVLKILRKSISYAKADDKKMNSDMAKIGFHDAYTCWLIYVLIAINIYCYYKTLSHSKLYAISPATVLAQGESYRLFTYMFMHGNVSHLFSNMMTLFYIGRILTEKTGNGNTLIIYITGGIIGGYVSCYAGLIRNTTTYTVGASGAIFALLGALLVNIFMNTNSGKKQIAKYCLITMILSNISPHVDVACHLAGFVAGGCTMLVINMMNAIHLNIVSINASKKTEKARW